MNKQSFSYTIFFTFIVTFFFTFFLSMTNILTEEMVELTAKERRQRSVLEAMNIEATSQQDVFEKYDELETRESGDELIYIKDNLIVSQFTGPGVWGPITGHLGMTADLREIVNVSILEENETPGLGGRVKSDEFLSQIRGEIVDERLEIDRGSGDYDKENSRIDAISGATGTSNAFEAMINNEISNLRDAFSDI